MIKNRKNTWLLAFLAAVLLALFLFNFIDYNFSKIYPNIQALRQYESGKIGFTDFLGKVNMPVREFPDYFISIYNSLTASNEFARTNLPIYQVYTKGENLDELNSNLPWSGEDTKKATIVLPDGTVCDAKLRYRGELFWHWWYPQKSLRIKFEKGACDNNMSSTVNLLNPKTMITIDQALSAYIGREMGLLSPEDYFVDVYINGDYMGAYEFLSQTNEQFLRKSGRLPGNYYDGENYSQPHRIFQKPDSWTKAATNNQFPENDTRDIRHLLSLVNSNYSNELVDFIDLDKFLKYYSHSQIFGYFHAGGYHNHKFYFDPSSGKFEPTVWDTTSNSMFTFKLGVDFIPNHFYYTLFTNPKIVSKKNEYLYSYVTNDTFFGLFEDYFEEQYGSLYPSLLKDKLKDYNTLTGNRPYSMSFFDEQYTVMLDYYRIRQDFIKHRLSEDSDIYVFRDQKDLKIIVFGETTVDANCTAPFVPVLDSENITISPSTYFELFPGRKNKPNEFGNSYDDYDMAVSGLEYTFNAPGEASCRFYNALTGNEIEPSFVETSAIWEKLSKKLTGETVSIHPWRLPQDPPPRHLVFGPEEYEINETIFLTECDTILIEPGAKLLFHENASIITYGNITASGTSESPIIFTAKNKEKPWGVIALQGQKAYGVFKHCIFEFGSQTYFKWVWYTGSLSVYNSHAKVSYSIFRDNRISDDMLNAKRADFSIDNSLFNNSFGDAIDFDFIDGLVEDNTFLFSGNDAVDLMGSRAIIRNNYMYGSGDKGISVGEQSSPYIYKNRMENCSIGIEIKDASDPVINATTITKNGIGINAYHKTMYYDYGGRGLLVDSIVCDNGVNLKMDDKSFLKIYPDLICDSKNCIEGLCK